MDGRGSGLLGALVAFIAGAFVGAAVGILFAPMSGRETRDQIKHRAEDFVEQGRDVYEEQRRRVVEAIDSGKHEAAQKSEEIRAQIEVARSKLKEGVDQVADFAGDQADQLKKLDTKKKPESAGA